MIPVLATLQVVLPLLRGVLGAVTKSNLPSEIIDSLTAGIDNLQKVHDHLVTRNELESLRVEVPW